MRSDAILPAAIPLLALVLLALPRVHARGLLARLRAVALIGLACAVAAFLMRRAQQVPQSPLEPFSLALACFLAGGLVLRESLEMPRVLLPLAGAAEALALGAGAATLALISRGPAAGLGLLGEPTGQRTIYALCALAGLFVAFTLTRVTVLRLGLAACAWFSIATGLVASDGPSLAAMLVAFMAAAAIGLISAERQGPPSPRLRGEGRG